MQDTNNNIIYTVVILKQFEENIKKACLEKHYCFREMNDDNSSSNKNEPILPPEEEIKKLEDEEKEMKKNIISWCHDAYKDWIHLKVIRLFVEATLRYGPPGKFLPFLMKVHAKSDKNIEKYLVDKYKDFGGKINAYNKENANDIMGYISENTEYPFVCINIEQLS